MRRAASNALSCLSRQDDDGANEIINLAAGIEVVSDTHSLVELIVRTLNVRRPVGLNNIVKVASLSSLWQLYVEEMREWLLAKRPLFVEETDTATPIAA